MLTSDLVRPRIRRSGETISVEHLDTSDAHWQKTAAALIQLFAVYEGRPRREWQTALDQFEGERVDYVVIRGLAKVLEDAATFMPLEQGLLPAEVRERLFAAGPVFEKADLFNPTTRTEVVKKIARDLRVSMKVVEQAMYADRLSEYILKHAGPNWTAEGLLTRYNLELSRGVLYDATGMRIEIHDHYKDVWRYLKLFKLMFEAAPLPNGGYRVQLDGPISPFVQSTRRYGVQFAAFLPALFLCERWQMRAEIQSGYMGKISKYTYSLDHQSALQSHFRQSGLFDSRLEADFAAEFAQKFGGARSDWDLTREDEIVLLGDTVFIPDFSVTHRGDQRRALIELVGFWHPNYLRRKVAKVRAAGLSNLVLLVRESVNLAPEALSEVPGEVIYFPNKPVIKDVMAAVERCAVVVTPGK